MYTVLSRQLGGERLVTATIYYRLPDFQDILQQFIWQEYDFIPELPRLIDFLYFSMEKIDGPLHSIEYTYAGFLIVPKITIRERKIQLNIDRGSHGNHSSH